MQKYISLDCIFHSDIMIVKIDEKQRPVRCLHKLIFKYKINISKTLQERSGENKKKPTGFCETNFEEIQEGG